MTPLCRKLRLARERIADPKDWRSGQHPDPDAPSDAPPYCAGSALWNSRGGRRDGKVEAEAIRRLLAAAGLPLPDQPDVDKEIDALVDWNDGSDHATVLAAFDRAIAECCRHER